MLSAFTARPIIELKQRDKSKIESILTYGDRVLVGLNTGTLRVYRLNELSTTQQPAPSSKAALETAINGSSSSNTAGTTPPTSSSLPKNAARQDAPSAAAAAAAAPPPPQRPTDLLREVEKFAPRAVEQLAVIKEANTLVSLSNHAVSLHDLRTFEPLEAPLARAAKGAACFAVTSNIVRDADTGVPEIISRLAVAVKRRLLLWSWHESELGGSSGDGDGLEEVVLPESIRCLTWASARKIVVGMNGGYTLVDVLSGEMEDIMGGGGAPGAGERGGAAAAAQAAATRFGAYSGAGMGYMGLGGYMPKPLATKLADGQMLLAKDINTQFITDEGRAIDKRQVPWQSAPESIGYSYPYILALQAPSRGSLEVRNPETLSLLQTISLPGAAQLHFPPPTVSLAHAGKGFHISSDRCVWKMDATDYDSQVGELVAGARYDEAISILAMLEGALLRDKSTTLREVKMLKAELLFRQKKYWDSMDLFNEDDVHAPPERVLRFFPRMIAGDLSEEPEKEAANEEEGAEDAGGAANGKANGDSNNKPKPEPVVDAASPPRDYVGITKMLLGGGRGRANPETASIASSRKGAAADADDAASVARSKSGDEGALEGKDLMTAVEALNSYLAGTRARLQRVIDPSTGRLKPKKAESGGTEEAFNSLLASTSHVDESDEQLEKELQRTFKIVDTAMFRALMFFRPALAGSLFRIPNFCDPEVVNERLLEHDRYTELVDFFYGKRLHRSALELLRRFGEGDRPDERAPGLHGPGRTVTYLQALPPEQVDLVLEFAEWALRADPDLGMEVFVADRDNAERLPRQRVLDFLARIDPALEVRYLEHVVGELGDDTPEFHNRLVEALVRDLREGRRRGDDDEDGDGDDGGRRRREKWDAAMGRLVQFLRESRQYSLSRAFGLVRGDDPAFYEAQAIVLSNMGQHKQALEIYVFKMKDYAKAEEYCNRIHKAQEAAEQVSPGEEAAQQTTPTPATTTPEDADDGSSNGGSSSPSIYTTLLSLYLTPPQPHERNLGPALDLLSRHGSRLPASSTLRLIPDSLPVAELESYFRGRMRQANSVVNETRIVQGLRKTEVVATQALLLLGGGSGGGGGGGKNRRVVIGDERVCGVCHKRLGGRTVVAALPDNSVVHYGCLNRAAAAIGNRPDSAGAAAAARVGSWGRTRG